MATLTVIEVVQTGVSALDAALVAASAGGDNFACPNDERSWIEVLNGGASPITVTINPVSPTSVYVEGAGRNAVAPISVSVAASARRAIGPFPAAFIDAGGKVNISYSGVTSVSVAAFHIAKLK
jgi:hypothetical protein